MFVPTVGHEPRPVRGKPAWGRGGADGVGARGVGGRVRDWMRTDFRSTLHYGGVRGKEELINSLRVLSPQNIWLKIARGKKSVYPLIIQTISRTLKM